MSRLGVSELLGGEPVGGVGANQSIAGNDGKELIASDFLDSRQIAERQMSGQQTFFKAAGAIMDDGNNSPHFKRVVDKRVDSEILLDLRDGA